MFFGIAPLHYLRIVQLKSFCLSWDVLLDLNTQANRFKLEIIHGLKQQQRRGQHEQQTVLMFKSFLRQLKIEMNLLWMSKNTAQTIRNASEFPYYSVKTYMKRILI